MSVKPEDVAETDPSVPLPDCGQRVSVQSPRHDEKLWTQMIGFKPGAYLILEKPPGADLVGGNRALRDGDSLVIRFVKDGSVFGFRTPVLNMLAVPHKLLFVAYPVEVVRHSLRSSPRLQCYLPCYGEVGGRAFSRAFIRDFSAAGCQLRVPLDALDPEEEGDTGEQGDISQAASPAALPESSGAQAEAVVGLEPLAPLDPNALTLNMQLPGEEEARIAAGAVLEWQTLPRYHLLRVKFDEEQLDLFEQLSLYTTQLG
jgi:hypothetical protein